MATSKFILRYAFLALTASLSVIATAKPSVKEGFYGSPATLSNVQRTIYLNKSYANVVQGETIKFITPQGEAFAWNFDTWTTNPFALSNIAPQNAAVGNVMIYVEPNPLYRGGSN
jgi:hypothetical protein